MEAELVEHDAGIDHPIGHPITQPVAPVSPPDEQGGDRLVEALAQPVPHAVPANRECW